MTVDTKEVVTTISYLIGVRKDILELNFAECKDTLDKLDADREATVIRYLCKLRTALLQHFKKTDNAMHYDLKNLTSLEWYDHDNIRQLEKWGIPIIQANYRAEKYMYDFTKLINENKINAPVFSMIGSYGTTYGIYSLSRSIRKPEC